jgi:hypothetical protein
MQRGEFSKTFNTCSQKSRNTAGCGRFECKPVGGNDDNKRVSSDRKNGCCAEQIRRFSPENGRYLSNQLTTRSNFNKTALRSNFNIYRNLFISVLCFLKKQMLQFFILDRLRKDLKGELAQRRVGVELRRDRRRRVADQCRIGRSRLQSSLYCRGIG